MCRNSYYFLIFLIAAVFSQEDVLCPEHEVFKRCMKECQEPHCYEDRFLEECDEECSGKCTCENGYFRSRVDGRCHQYEECPKPRCGENEEFVECGTLCEPECGAPFPRNCDSIECLPNVCQCKSGYKRGFNGCQLPDAKC
ncbi:hypothetical protein WR25_21681 [Diploscapter pachys]|uniref:TIL domain-containing protein n=1 Tax=Diploscapter pachys TaxID=2018661 RepID=A0A2A2LC76_9BILA|nr:hypothetical protein WR25_21681 [Diploscapter pachys]